MDYQQALDYLKLFEGNKIKLGLGRVSKLTELLDINVDKLQVVHVAGTNGKGSTCKYIESVLLQARYNVGLFVSPYFLTQRDAIRAGGSDMTESELLSCVISIKSIIDKYPELSEMTRFEVVTVLALLHFVRANCDIIVLEVGLGGTYDSTNIVKPLVSVITKISYDHMEFLGDTIESIASNKAGIIKNNSCVVVALQEYKEASAVLHSIAKQKNCKTIFINPSDIKQHQASKCYQLSYKDIFNIELPLRGVHQVQNATTAIETCCCLREFGYRVEDSDIVKGVQAVVWPLRLQQVSSNPNIIIDGAHNVDGIKALVDYIIDNDYSNVCNEVKTHDIIRKGMTVDDNISVQNKSNKKTSNTTKNIASNNMKIQKQELTTHQTTQLVTQLATQQEVSRNIFVLGILKDKEYEKMAQIVCIAGDVFYCCEPPSIRACSSEALCNALLDTGVDAYACVSIYDAVRQAINSSRPIDTIYIAGSLYMAAQAYMILKDMGKIY